MIRVAPDWTVGFRCTASACRHSCCVGWEVDVDPEALERYRRVPGPFGHRLARGIALEGTPHFRLDSRERCPFLNRDNLCDIILELGEGALCQICADHPRFRNWFPDRVEEGLGLCCEEAARLLLTHEGPVRAVARAWEGEEAALEPGEAYPALLRRRDGLLDLLQDRAKPLRARLCEAFSLHGMTAPEPPFSETLELLLGLEHLEDGWREALEALGARPELWTAWDEDMEGDGERLLVYLVWRYYLSWGLERWDEGFPLRFGRLSLGLLGALRGLTRAETGRLTLAGRVEWLRRWSAELEYSEDNLEALADYLSER